MTNIIKNFFHKSFENRSYINTYAREEKFGIYAAEIPPFPEAKK